MRPCEKVLPRDNNLITLLYDGYITVRSIAHGWLQDPEDVLPE